MLPFQVRQDVYAAIADQIMQGKAVLVVGSGLDYGLLAGAAAAWLRQFVPILLRADTPPITVGVESGGHVMFLDLSDGILCDVAGRQLAAEGGPDLVIVVEDEYGTYNEHYNRYVLPAICKAPHSDIWVLPT
jgi:hypothetical protein